MQSSAKVCFACKKHAAQYPWLVFGGGTAG
jgi:hypothetical protein